MGQMIMNLPAIQELLLLLSHFSHVRLCVIPQTAATRLPRPWDSPGKNTGVDCHFLLQCMKVKSESEVAQSCPTLSDPMDCSLPGSSIHWNFTFPFHALEKEMATHSSVLAWRIPGMGKPGGCRLWDHTESDTTEVT